MIVFLISFLLLQDIPTYYYVTEYGSGRNIVKVESGKLEVLIGDMGGRHYPHNNSPKISSSGKYMVFQSDPDAHDRYSIWTMQLDTKEKKRITTQEGMYPNWFPGEEYIIYTGRRDGVWEILKVSISGGKETNLTRNKEKGIRPGWGASTTVHPNGNEVIFSYVREKKLMKLDLSSGTISEIGLPETSYAHPLYSPDGKRLAVNVKTSDSYDLEIIDLATMDSYTVVKDVVSYAAPCWSADGKKLLFTSSDGDQEISMVSIKTGKVQHLTSNAGFDAMPVW